MQGLNRVTLMFAGCGHVSGLLMRLMLPLALMKSAR